MICYEMGLFNEAIDKISSEADCLLYCSGSETRFFSIINQLSSHSIGKDMSSIEIALTERSNLSSNPISNMRKNGIKIDCSIQDEVTLITNLKKAISSYSSVALDISGFPKSLIFMILKLLSICPNIVKCFAMYTEEIYKFPSGNFLDWSSTYGTLTAKEVSGFGGIVKRGEESQLIVFGSFDGDMAYFVQEEMAPDEFIFINGFPSFQLKYKDISIISNEKLLDQLSPMNDLYNVDASNPFEMYNFLENITKSRFKGNLSILPLGPKPMALGAALFASQNDSCRIIYPAPEGFRAISPGTAGESWYYDISSILS